MRYVVRILGICLLLTVAACAANKIATIVIDPATGGSTTSPATPADVEEFYTTYIAPLVVAQVNSLIDAKITASEQRNWQRMTAALSDQSVLLQNTMDAKVRAAEIAGIQLIITNLQARLQVLQQP
jgi:hypothetical protein